MKEKNNIHIYPSNMLFESRIYKIASTIKKLDIYDGPVITIPDNIKQNAYKCRKYESIEYTKYFIRNDENNREFFNKHKKKDDLADSYLQCLTYYKKNNMNA